MPCKISLCLIAKNEQDVLEKSLASVCSLADELVLVDTGSTDSTKQIMSRFSPNVYDFEWINDFSAARNFAGDKSCNQLILAWDADWYIEKDSLLKLKNTLKKPFDLLKISLVLDYQELGQSLVPKRILSYPLIYNKNLYTWKYPIHNQLIAESKQPKVIHEPEIKVFHLRPPDSKPWRFKQTTDILKREIQKSGATTEEVYRSKFFLARNFYHQGNFPEAIELYEEILAVSIPNLESRIHLLENLSFCFLKQKRYEDLEKLISENSTEFFSQARLILILADLKLLGGFSEEAKTFYKKFLDLDFQPKNTELEYDIYRYQVYPRKMIARL